MRCARANAKSTSPHSRGCRGLSGSCPCAHSVDGVVRSARADRGWHHHADVRPVLWSDPPPKSRYAPDESLDELFGDGRGGYRGYLACGTNADRVSRTSSVHG